MEKTKVECTVRLLKIVDSLGACCVLCHKNGSVDLLKRTEDLTTRATEVIKQFDPNNDNWETYLASLEGIWPEIDKFYFEVLDYSEAVALKSQYKPGQAPSA